MLPEIGPEARGIFEEGFFGKRKVEVLLAFGACFFLGGGGCKQGERKDPFWQEYVSLTVSPNSIEILLFGKLF